MLCAGARRPVGGDARDSGSTAVSPVLVRFPAFEVRECSGVDELRREFEANGLQGLFSEFVLPLVK